MVEPISVSAVGSPRLFEGWRIAGLVGVVAQDGRLTQVGFEAMNRPDLFGVEADAFCRRANHPAPAPGCGCGFYSLREPESALARPFLDAASRRPHDVLLRVALSGTVVESTRGWRASHQTVRQVFVSPRCHRGSCDVPPSMLLPSAVVTLDTVGRWMRLLPVCSRHSELVFAPVAHPGLSAPPPPPPVPMGALSRLSGVPVSPLGQRFLKL